MAVTRLPVWATSERLKEGKSALPSILELFLMDTARWEDDFMGDQFKYDSTGPGTYQGANSGTSSAVAAILTGNINGAIRTNTGTDDDGYSNLSLGLHFRGDRNAHVWWRVQVSAITSHKFEFGFTDVVAGTDAGAVNNKATPTFNADDAVVIILDTDANATLSLLGVKATAAATALHFSNALAAATDYYLGVELLGDKAKGYILNENGGLIEQTPWMDSAVTPTTLLTPWMHSQARAGSANRTVSIDYLLAYQRRTAA